MKGLFMRLKGMMKQPAPSEPIHIPEEDEGYVELSTDSSDVAHSKITVRPFILEDFNGVKGVLDAIREGYTVALINIKPLKDSDIVELKRAINKLKKTCDAIDGDIAGFGEDWICVTPSFAHIHRDAKTGVARAQSEEEMSDLATF